MERTKWIDRKFNFDLPPGWIYNIIERLYGTPLRLRHITKGLSKGKLNQKTNNQWSIQEHIGHLLDLEELHEGRIDDFLARKEVLRPADMTNQKTYSANHQLRQIDDLLNDFALSRTTFIQKLSSLDDEAMVFRSLHQRLQLMMKPVDMAFFTAEHDDHHLASIRLLIKS